jgi:hypothetical protein
MSWSTKSTVLPVVACSVYEARRRALRVFGTRWAVFNKLATWAGARLP